MVVLATDPRPATIYLVKHKRKHKRITKVKTILNYSVNPKNYTYIRFGYVMCLLDVVFSNKYK